MSDLHEQAREWLSRQTDLVDCRINGVGQVKLASCHARQRRFPRYEFVGRYDATPLNPRFSTCRDCPHWLSDEDHDQHFSPVERKKMDHDGIVGGAARQGRLSLVNPKAIPVTDASKAQFRWRKSQRIDNKWKIG